MVVVDVEDRGAVAAPQEVDRHPVDVAAVEEDHGSIDEVDRRLVEHLLQRQEPILDRQGELLRGEEHDRVLAELGEDSVERQERAEGVAVGALVGGEQEALPVAQLGDHAVDVRRQLHRRAVHPSSSSSRESRTPRSGPSS